MKVIEFYGLPGAGKTTISKDLCEELGRREIRFATADTYLNEYNSRKSTVKSLLRWSGLRFLFSALRVAFKHKMFTNKKVIARLIRIVPLLEFYNKHKEEVIVMDQAVIQQYISAFYNYCELEEQDILVLSTVIQDYNITAIRVITSPETAESRITIRDDKNHGRLDSIANIESRMEVLHVQAKNFILGSRVFKKLGTGIEFDNTNDGVIDISELVRSLDLEDLKG